MQDTTRRTAFRAAALAVAANLALVAVVAASAPGPDYLDVESWSARAQGVNGVRLTVTTDGSIPKRPDSFINDNAVVGFAWVDGATFKALVVTIHPVIGRDSYQRPDSWHVHTASLGAGTGASDACVLSIDSTPTAGINVQGNQVSINLARDAMPNLGGGERLDPDSVDLATGFTIQGDGGCGSGLGVVLRT
jgi:hypothetical protein